MSTREFKHAETIALREDLDDAYMARSNEPVPFGVRDVFDDYCTLHDMKLDFMADVAARGVVEKFSQGRQSFRRENKSVMMIAKLSGEQVKLLKAIGLVKASKASDGEEQDDDDGSFDEFDGG